MASKYNETIFFIAGLAAAGGAILQAWLSGAVHKYKENKFNADLKKQLTDKKLELQHEATRLAIELNRNEQYLSDIRREFDAGYIRGRKWLAEFISEADRAFDESISLNLVKKKHPALKAAEEVAAARLEKRKLKEKLKFYEYQLKSYKEYFPFLEEYEEIILDEAVQFVPTDSNKEVLENSDPVLLYVQKAEYEKLLPVERNQLALDRYLSRTLSKAAIGRFYERYLGYIYENDGWQVEYRGIIDGYEDLGRDLICKKDDEIIIIQAKCWSFDKLIHEKHLFQLYGTTQLYLIDIKNGKIKNTKVIPIFITTTTLSPVAKDVAKWLKIKFEERFSIDKAYPMIKCNINQSTKEKIYHLPFDQQYDRTKIIPKLGEIYATSVREAEQMGFRRAFRHHDKSSGEGSI